MTIPSIAMPDRPGMQPGRTAEGAVVPAPLDVLIHRLRALFPLQSHEVAGFCRLVREIVTVPANHDILEEQRAPREALVLLEGLACHYRDVGGGRRQMTGLIVPGDFCDYGFLSSSPVRQRVLSLGRAVVGRIDLAQLSAFADRNPNVIVAAMRAASIDQACARELVISLGARDALGRVAYFFCEMYQRLRVVGLVDQNGEFDLAMTQAELGEALGLSTVHVNRTIQQLRRRKLIAMSHGTVTVPDMKALAEVAAFDGRYLRTN